MSAGLIEIKGKKYKNLNEACLDSGLNIHNLNARVIYNRCKSGMSIDDAFNKPRKGTVINGKEYFSVTEACMDTELNKYNLSPNIVLDRIRNGISLSKAFDIPPKQELELTILGKRYNSLDEALNDKELNVGKLTRANVIYRISKGDNLDKIFSKGSKNNNIIIKGMRYDNLAAACTDFNLNKHGLSYNVVLGRLRNGISIDEVFDFDLVSIPKEILKYNIQGKWYTSIEEACKDPELNVSKLSYADVMMYISRGVSLDKVFKIPNKHKTIKQAYTDPNLNIHGLSYNTIVARIKGGMSVKEAFMTPPIERLTNIRIGDKVYKSLYSACADKGLNIHKLSYNTILIRYKGGMSLEDAFKSIPKRDGIDITINGKYFSNIKEACNDMSINIHNISYNTIKTRLDRGWEIDRAFLTPLRSRVQQVL